MEKNTLIDKAKMSLTEAKSTTAVKAWTFTFNKQHYVMLKFRNVFDFVEIYESTKQGRKTSKDPLVSFKNSSDTDTAFETALNILNGKTIEHENTDI